LRLFSEAGRTNSYQVENYFGSNRYGTRCGVIVIDDIHHIGANHVLS
jgi:hypothetical protein